MKTHIISILIICLLQITAFTQSSHLQPIAKNTALPEHSRFGQSVALDGSVALIGAPGEGTAEMAQHGAVYIYEKNDMNWNQTARLIASDGSMFDNFGQAVALKNKTALIGAPSDFRGAAYIFTEQNGNWTKVQKLTPVFEENEIPHPMRFGAAVALNGNRLVVGAPHFRKGFDQIMGAVFIFKFDGTSWILEERLEAPGEVFGAQFGESLAMDEDRLLVSAPGTHGGADNSGAAYLYERKESGWELIRTFINPDSRSYELFGSSIDLDGPWVIIGTKMHSMNDLNPTGGAHIFVETAVGWQQTTTLMADDGQRNDFFGESVAIQGNMAAVSAVRAHHNAKEDAGAVYLYENVNGFWQQVRRLAVDEDTEHHLYLGGALAMYNGTLLIGAHLEDNDQNDSGNTYFHTFDFSVDAEAILPFPYTLHPVAPNPFSHETIIRFDLPRSGNIELTAYDALGRRVATLANGQFPEGREQRITWHPTNLEPGIYFIRLITTSYQQTQQVIFVQ